MSRPKKKYLYNNKECTIDELCATARIAKPTFHELRRKGLSIEQIINNRPNKGRPKKIWTYNDKEYTMSEICTLAKRSDHDIYRLLKKGWTIEQIVNNKPSKHGMSRTRLYSIYQGMVKRCYYPKSVGYKNYHDRGIAICDEWLNDKIAFFEWAMNNGYQDGLTIDRVDNNKGYSPDNCRWATGPEQQTNKQDSFRLDYHGELLTVREIAEREHIEWGTAYHWYVEGRKIKLPRRQLYERSDQN